MARLLVQLKLRLLTNALRSSARARVGFMVSSAFAVLLAIGTFAGLALLRGNAASVDLAAAVFTVFAFGWLILPLVAFGLDGTLDPATLALYPVRTWPLVGGLLAASLTGAWPLANVIGLLGVTVGLARGALGILVAIIAVVLQVLFCIALARCVTTGLAGLLRSRRGRDLGVFLIIPIFALYETFAQVVPKLASEGAIHASVFDGVDKWLRWLPPGLAAHAIQDASTGHAGTAFARLGLLAVIILVLGAVWVRSLSRSLVAVDTTTQSTAGRGRPLPFARGGIVGTVVARYLIYQRRDPPSIMRWCIVAILAIVTSLGSIKAHHHYHVGLFISAIIGAAMVGALNSNSIGLTGPAFGLEAAAMAGVRQLRAYLTGRVIALGSIAVPLLLLTSLIVTLIAGHLSDWLWVMPVDLGALGASLGLSTLLVVNLPYPMQQRVGSPVPTTGDGYGGQAFGGVVGTLAGTALASVPLILAVNATDSLAASVRIPVLVAGFTAYGLLLIWAGIRGAANVAAGTLPELTQIALASRL
jgi:ABC-2 type transport system permease protein